MTIDSVKRADENRLRRRFNVTRLGEEMVSFHPEFLVDEQNERRAVVLPVAEWQMIVEELEELDDIRSFDTAKSQPSDAVPFEDAVNKIERGEPL